MTCVSRSECRSVYRMKFMIVLMALFAHPANAAESTNEMRFAFATVEEGKQVLTNRDEFVQRLSGFDRAARLKTNRAVDEGEFLKFVGESVQEFTAQDTNLVRAAVKT